MNENFPENLVVTQPKTVSDLLIRSLRYLDRDEGRTADRDLLLEILPYLRDAVELATNRTFLVPAQEFVKLGTLNSDRRQFDWGIGANDIDYPYPERIQVLFLAQDNLVLYDRMGHRIESVPNNDNRGSNIFYILSPMEGHELAASQSWTSTGYPTRYFLQRTTPRHVLYLDSTPYGTANTLYAVATFPFVLPEVDEEALNYQLRLQTGHYTYLWSKTALLASREYGLTDDVINTLVQINGEAMSGIEDRNYEIERQMMDTGNIFRNPGYGRNYTLGSKRRHAIFDSLRD